MGLLYIGDGAYIPGYPARDLSAEEVEKYGEDTLLGLDNGRLYALPDKPTKKKNQPAKDGD